MAKKNNILLLIADDLGKYLGCYGEDTIQTPNIDKLAAQGALFDMAFTSTASCSASRSVIYTGLQTHENGQYGLNNDRHHFTTFDHSMSVPRLYPWEIREESDTGDVAWVADRAAAFFDRSTSGQKPFLLTVGYIDPHRDLTRSGFGNGENITDVRITPSHYTPADAKIPPFLSDVPGVRLELAEYYRSIHRLDQGVGLILAALENARLANDTLVVFMSDNGPPFVNSETTLYDAGVRLPLIIRRPEGDPDQGQAPGTLIFGFHTFHEVTNYCPTRYMRTRSFKYHRNIARKLDFPFAADLYGSLSWEGLRNSDRPMLGSRTLKSHIRRPPEELYDLEADPQEVRNLATEPEFAGQLKDMRDALEAW
ncbi:hypothetical protein FQN53_009337 [Emmonsiellopsis sp. PD_33]|nr:hypothetical protein FQN53_009337 [Emmonsiellopsis sp. PD_33]